MSLFSCILISMFACAHAARDSGLRGVSVHRAQMSFSDVLIQAMKSDAFKKEVDMTVPMMCDGSDNPEKCKEYITKAIMCTNFLERAESLLALGEDMAGAQNFVLRCKSIQRQVPNLASVFSWVQNPDTVFNMAVDKAQDDTGVSLGGSISKLKQLSEADKEAQQEDAELGLQPLGSEA
eukprot:gnl/MRDRNA2_/MRDRNA2_99189_c0_seq1.p1 gnl/MRDRNA2_/MRDRNA2_99189_c0~~gnl/MRDRNA2_/MRDRNA2_99189_c0_seq1.p1  ORF type:complete len:179 (-),score=48.16 gnl/MRDRNA2_/MRDRNA2_99189_c0_seq1:121-657(-)